MPPQLSTAPGEACLLTPGEVAQRLRFSQRTIVEWLRWGILPGVKIAKRWRVSAEDLAQFLDERAQFLAEERQGR